LTRLAPHARIGGGQRKKRASRAGRGGCYYITGKNKKQLIKKNKWVLDPTHHFMK